MSERRTIRRAYGKLKVFDKSLIYSGVVMFVQQDPERVPDLIPKLDDMLEQAYLRGKEDSRNAIAKKYKEFRLALGKAEGD